MNAILSIKTKAHAVAFAAIVAVLASIMAGIANFLFLDHDLARRVTPFNMTIGLIVAFGMSWLVGLKVMEVNILTAKLEYLASFDFLTGAMTRSRFFAGLLSLRDRSGAILVFDMDRFKLINDTLGHAAGDRALFIVAEVTRRNLGPNDSLCRLGGDEFCAFFPGIGPDKARTIAQWIGDGIAQETVSAEGKSISLSASIGMAMLDAGGDIDAAIAIADADLYHIKASRRRTGVVLPLEPDRHRVSRG